MDGTTKKSSPLLLGLLLVVLATLGRHGLLVVLSALTAKMKRNVVTYRNHVQKSMMHVQMVYLGVLALRILALRILALGVLALGVLALGVLALGVLEVGILLSVRSQTETADDAARKKEEARKEIHNGRQVYRRTS
jgi:hypothetical protein